MSVELQEGRIRNDYCVEYGVQLFFYTSFPESSNVSGTEHKTFRVISIGNIVLHVYHSDIIHCL